MEKNVDAVVVVLGLLSDQTQRVIVISLVSEQSFLLLSWQLAAASGVKGEVAVGAVKIWWLLCGSFLFPV